MRRGGVGGHNAELPTSGGAATDAKWAELVTPATGFIDYARLEAAARALG